MTGAPSDPSNKPPPVACQPHTNARTHARTLVDRRAGADAGGVYLLQGRRKDHRTIRLRVGHRECVEALGAPVLSGAGIRKGWLVSMGVGIDQRIDWSRPRPTPISPSHPKPLLAYIGPVRGFLARPVVGAQHHARRKEGQPQAEPEPLSCDGPQNMGSGFRIGGKGEGVSRSVEG